MEHLNEENIKCPYCGFEDYDSWEFDQDKGTTECGDCGEEFNVTRDIEVTYSTSRIACEDGEHNYKFERFFIKKQSYLGKHEWKDLPEQNWEYFLIEVCELCDDREFVSISKDEYDRALAV